MWAESVVFFGVAGAYFEPDGRAFEAEGLADLVFEEAFKAEV
jgi:hypothetical protein